MTAFLPVGFLPATRVQSWSSSSSSPSSVFHWGCSARLRVLDCARVGCLCVFSWLEAMGVVRFCSVTWSVKGSALDLLCLPGLDCVASEYVAAAVYAFVSAWAVSVSRVGECALVRVGVFEYADITQALTSLTRLVNFSSRACVSLPRSVNRSVSDSTWAESSLIFWFRRSSLSFEAILSTSSVDTRRWIIEKSSLLEASSSLGLPSAGVSPRPPLCVWSCVACVLTVASTPSHLSCWIAWSSSFFVQAGLSCSGRREKMLNQGRYGVLNRQWSFRCWSWGCTNVGAGPYNSLCRHLPSSSHRENFCSNCVLRSISILKRSQEIGLRRHPAWIPPNVEGGSLRWKPNTRKELSKATEKGERLGFFRGAPKPETTPTVRGRHALHIDSPPPPPPPPAPLKPNIGPPFVWSVIANENYVIAWLPIAGRTSRGESSAAASIARDHCCTCAFFGCFGGQRRSEAFFSLQTQRSL